MEIARPSLLLKSDCGLVWMLSVVPGLGGGHWIRKPPWKPELQPAVQGQWPLIPGKGGMALQVFICLIGMPSDRASDLEFGFLFGLIRSFCSLTSC